jgi:hypothetical protein
MTDPVVVEVLRELLVKEQRCLAFRLLESTVFVSDAAVNDLSAVKEIARESNENSASLTKLILELRGAPVLRTGDMATADLHYQAVEYVLPRLVEDREALVHSYRDAVEKVSQEHRAGDLLTRILSRHQEELHCVKQLSGNATDPPE